MRCSTVHPPFARWVPHTPRTVVRTSCRVDPCRAVCNAVPWSVCGIGVVRWHVVSCGCSHDAAKPAVVVRLRSSVAAVLPRPSPPPARPPLRAPPLHVCALRVLTISFWCSLSVCSSSPRAPSPRARARTHHPRPASRQPVLARRADVATFLNFRNPRFQRKFVFFPWNFQSSQGFKFSKFPKSDVRARLRGGAGRGSARGAGRVWVVARAWATGSRRSRSRSRAQQQDREAQSNRRQANGGASERTKDRTKEIEQERAD